MPKLTQMDLWINEQIKRGRSFEDLAAELDVTPGFIALAHGRCLAESDSSDIRLDQRGYRRNVYALIHAAKSARTLVGARWAWGKLHAMGIEIEMPRNLCPVCHSINSYSDKRGCTACGFHADLP